ncbi:FxsA family protein [Thiosocius teredinicola]|uniref:FxsA family protein n=1 Tax=Thiosocius teredinicola TaxID=1973002 RepID=UPI000990AFEF
MINPAVVFLLIFVGAPLVELYLLIEVGSVIGALPTILLSIFTAALGGWLVRMQGFSVLFRAQSQMANKEVPAIELLEGVLLLLTGLALLLPGFVTDAIGFLLLITPLRRWLIVHWLKSRGTLRPAAQPGARTTPETQADRIIEGEYRRDE